MHVSAPLVRRLPTTYSTHPLRATVVPPSPVRVPKKAPSPGIMNLISVEETRHPLSSWLRHRETADPSLI